MFFIGRNSGLIKHLMDESTECSVGLCEDSIGLKFNYSSNGVETGAFVIS